MNQVSLLCIASFFKGEDFLRAAKQEGCRIYLLTSKKHEQRSWPWDSIDETFYVQDDGFDHWKMEDVVAGLAYVMRSRKIDRIVALDDFDVEKAAQLRETFRVPGMGQTTARYFRDKLAMRLKAAEAGINVPAFSALFNDDEIHSYISKTEAPWLVKPRGEASATGIQKANSPEELWQIIHALGEKRHEYLVEQFRPGDVYHVDSLNFDRDVVFARVSRYLSTPMDVAHGGGIFRSVTIKFGSADDVALQQMNREVMQAFGMKYSASHTEFIKSREDGKYYFLETASRVGGANLAEMVEMSSGINLWAEWAKLEVAVARGIQYNLPAPRMDYAGIIVSLSRHQWPDSSGFADPEICWRMKKEYHIGLIVKAAEEEQVIELLEGYAERIKIDFHASLPVSAKHAD